MSRRIQEAKERTGTPFGGPQSRPLRTAGRTSVVEGKQEAMIHNNFRDPILMTVRTL